MSEVNVDLIQQVCDIWNPTGEAKAAIEWFGKDGGGFKPYCKYTDSCRDQYEKGACKSCNKKDIHSISSDLITHNMNGSNKRLGIYPMISDDLIHWIASDFDKHADSQDPVPDVRNLIEQFRAFEIPFSLFKSKSNGYHSYLFFDALVPAYKARALYMKLIENSGIDIANKKDRTGAFDDIFPKQDSLKGKTVGNLIAMPWSGMHFKTGGCCFVNPDTFERMGDTIDDNIEMFIEYKETISLEMLDDLLKELGVNPIDPAIIPPSDYESRIEKEGDVQDDRPGGDYNKRGKFDQLLNKHGWKSSGTSQMPNGDPVEYWTRPGKTGGTSGSLINDKVFYTFTSSVQGLESEKGYRLFSLYTHLEHNGNFSAAAGALAADGFGTPLDNNEHIGQILNDPITEPESGTKRIEACRILSAYYLKKNDKDQVIEILNLWNDQNTPPLSLKSMQIIVGKIETKQTKSSISNKFEEAIEKIEILEYPDGEERYKFYIKNGKTRTLKPDEIESNKKFRVRMWGCIYHGIPPIKQSVWISLMNNLLSEAQVIIMSEDETDVGIVRAIITDDLRKCQLAIENDKYKPEKFAKQGGKDGISTKAFIYQDRALVKLDALMGFIKAHSETSKLTRKDICTILRRLGFDNNDKKLVRVGKHRARFWLADLDYFMSCGRDS